MSSDLVRFRAGIIGRRPAWLAFASALLVAAGLLGFRGRVHSGRRRDPAPELAELAAAVAGAAERPIDARVAGFRYAPAPGPASRSLRNDPVSPDVRIAAARIERRAQLDDTPATETALGVAYLMTRDVARAIPALEDASKRTPADAEALTALSAAYLARADSTEHADDAAAAFDAADRAVRLDPALVEAWFDRALTIHALHLDRSDRDAWHEVIARETDTRWLAEDRERSARRSPGADVWTAVRDDLLRRLAEPSTAVDAARVIGQRYAGNARIEAENQDLPAWGAHYLKGERHDADASLRAAAELGAAVAAAGGDRMVADATRLIQRALGSNDAGPARALAEGYRLFGEGMELLQRNRVRDADDTLTRANAAFGSLPAPHRLWATVIRALDLRAQGHLEQAFGLLSAPAFRRSRAPYAYVDGRSEWLEGLIEAGLGDFEGAVQHDDRGIERFHAARETESFAQLESNLASVIAYFGEPAEAWRHELNAMEAFDALASPAERRLVASNGATLSLMFGLPHTALRFQDVLVAQPSAVGDISRPEGLVFRARIESAIGLQAVARADLENAAAGARTISDPSLRRWVDAEIDATRAQGRLAAGPGRNVDDDDALGFFSAAHITFATIPLLRWRAQESLAAGDVGRARDSLVSAVGEFERARSQIADPQARLLSADEAWSAYGDLIDLEYSRLHDSAAALRYAEGARSRILATPGAQPPDPDASIAATKALRQTVVVDYVLLPTRVVAYVLGGGRLQAVPLAIHREAIARDADELARAFARRSLADFRRAARELYDGLLAPVMPLVGDGAGLAIVPDGAINRIPFAALIGPDGHYVIERHAITVAPNVAGLVAATRRMARLPVRFGSALVVAPAATRDVTGTDLPALPGAAAEAHAVADTYARPLLLEAAAATVDAFRKDAGTREVVHFAGHSVVNPQFPRLSRMLFSREGDAVALTGDQIERMTFDRTAVVVLGSCEAASGRVVLNQGVESLVRQFLAAGVPSVVASLWQMDDSAAVGLFRDFHARLRASGDPVRSLQTAQLGALQRQPGDLSWVGLVAYGTTPR